MVLFWEHVNLFKKARRLVETHTHTHTHTPPRARARLRAVHAAGLRSCTPSPGPRRLRSHSRTQRAYSIGYLALSGGLLQSVLAAPAAAPQQQPMSSISARMPPNTPVTTSTDTSNALLSEGGSATGARGEGGEGGVAGGEGGCVGGDGGWVGGGGGDGLAEGGGKSSVAWSGHAPPCCDPGTASGM